jgi:hypothetical protein
MREYSYKVATVCESVFLLLNDFDYSIIIPYVTESFETRLNLYLETEHVQQWKTFLLLFGVTTY